MGMHRFEKEKPVLFDQVLESAHFVQSRYPKEIQLAIILGTGLGNLTEQMTIGQEIPYASIPNFPVSTVESHAGKLVLGELAGLSVVVMSGRFHYYEGYSLEEVTFPVRVMRKLGASNLVVTNAAGGMNLTYRKGEIVLLEDMINFMGVNPLIGPNDDRLGPRFPDMCEPFSGSLMSLAEEAGRKAGVSVRRGTYIGVTGPCLETRAEYRMMHQFGADVVGMSTVPEVIVAVHSGFKTLGISVITDLCDPDKLLPVDIKEIIQVANEASPKLDKLIVETAKMIKEND